MKPIHRVFVSLALAVLVGAPPLLASRPGRAGVETEPAQRQVIPFDRGGQSERPAPDAAAPERPAHREGGPRITPFCEPVPEKYFISSLGSIATDLGTAGYVIDQPGRYVLTRNLAVPAVDIGILVRAHNVVIDLARHRLSDPTGGAILVQVGDTMNVIIQNGGLDGGEAGVVARGPTDWTRHFLTLRGLSISGTATGYRPVSIQKVHHFRLEGSIISGGEIVLWDNFDSRIVGNRIRASLSGDITGGRLVNNLIEGTARLNGRGALIRGNRIRGLSSLWALHAGGPGFIVDNEIRVDTKPYALVSEGPMMVRNNVLRGGTYDTLVVGSDRSLVVGNVIDSDTIGIGVERSNNLIERNEIGGAGPYCGIYFYSESRSNVYRRNRFSKTAALVCGEPNIDGGDNLAAGCPEEACHSTAGPGRLVLAGDDDRGTTLGRLARSCEPGEVVLISEARPGVMEGATVGVFIDEPGYYLLTQDLRLPPSDIGVLISADDVTLDLGGHTISAASLSEAARIIGGENVVIRHGEFRGGGVGLRVIGDVGSDMTRVRVEKLRLQDVYPESYTALQIHDLDYLEIIDSILGGVGSMGIVSGHTMGVIERTRIAGSANGVLELYGLHDGILRDNEIDRILQLGGANLVSGNILRTLQLGGSDNTVVNNAFENLIEAGSEAHRTLIADNISTSAAVMLHSSQNRVLGNSLGWLTVGGSANRIDSNLITSSGNCGLKFVTEGAHSYGDNVIHGPEGVCGALNLDQGGNIFPAPRCNNGRKAASEICDKQDTAGLACADFGFQGGTLQCNATCDGFDTSGCTGP